MARAKEIDLDEAATLQALPPGRWCRSPGGTVWVACAGCGAVASLDDHSIAPDGTVSPSLVCPAGCGWHVFARLITRIV